MAGCAAARRLGVGAVAVFGIACVLGVARPAAAFEYFDGRLQIHGFYEQQIRGLADDFDLTDDLDLAQWYHVLNVEVEYELAPDGWGPFDLISTFARIEGRYDCVWTRGCGMLRSANAFGNRTEHLPKRLIGAQREGFVGTVDDIDRRPFAGVPVGTGTEPGFFDDADVAPGPPGAAPSTPDTSGTALGPGFFPDGYLNKSQLSRVFAVVPEPNTALDDQMFAPYTHRRRPVDFFGIPGVQTLFGSRGPDTFLGSGDEPAPFIFSPFEGCIFALRDTKGEKDGASRQIMGPWNPGCKIRNLGSIRNKPNPFNPLDSNPVLTPVEDGGLTLGADLIANGRSGPGLFGDAPPSSFGSTALPFKPPPENPAGVGAPSHESQGIFYPNKGVRNLILRDEFDAFDQNFRQAELEWNRGASQQDEKELKELYADIEMFDSRLWLRVGKQNIVWGKTELFRTTDQFNPQDLALATLPSLEESRIGLWAVRGVWSFYEVGPLEDVRLELAFNYDQFEPADLGRCGEPFTPNPVCNKTFGLFAHGFAGLAVAGERRPPDPWNGFKGIEVGARVEWRLGPFSFQLADFYGYNDFPWTDRVFTYSRNVDPLSGRPRRAFTMGECDDPSDPSCLGDPTTSPASVGNNWFNDTNNDGYPDRVQDLPLAPGVDCVGAARDPECDDIVTPESHLEDVVVNTTINQQLYALICSTSIGFSPTLDPTVCAQSVLNSPNLAGAAARVTNLVGGLIAGDPSAAFLVQNQLTSGYLPPFVRLSADPSDDLNGNGASNLAPSQRGIGLAPLEATLSELLTDEQEALLGCGPFYGTHCDDDGPDLANAEASAIIQSWPGYDGSTGRWRLDGIDTDGDGLGDVLRPNPGTFDAGPDGDVGTADDLAGPDGILGNADDYATPAEAFFQGGAPCTRFENGVLYILPGCRGPDYDATTLAAQLGGGTLVVGDWDPDIDGCSRPNAPGCAGATGGEDPDGPGAGVPDGRMLFPVGDLDGDGTPGFDHDGNPGTPQVSAFGVNSGRLHFQSEMAAASWNALMAFVALSTIPDSVDNATGVPPGEGGGAGADRPPLFDEFDQFNSPSGPGFKVTDPEWDPTTMGPLRLNGCSFLRPQDCSNVSSVFSVIGHQRNDVRAGGNGRFGRQDFVWHGGGTVVLSYERRNVLGLSMDFAEDVTKSNWGAELTWIEGLRFTDNDQIDGTNKADTYNLTVSVDRPTFINFLNPNRTFFFNSQWFFQYVRGYESSFTSNGPFNVLATFTVLTGYSQDRLLPGVTFVYDFNSNSGGALPNVTYRFTENFSATVGANLFWGRWEERVMPISPISLTNRVGRNAYKEFVENAVSVVRDREEIFLRIRYTF